MAWIRPKLVGWYDQTDCRRISCDKLKAVRESDGELYEICTNQGTLNAPFRCRVLDAKTGRSQI